MFRKKHTIQNITAREILSSGGYPTVEATVTLKNGISARASVAWGASDGKGEAFLLLDKNSKRFNGKGMKKGVRIIESIIAKELQGYDVHHQERIDHRMLEIDGTKNKSRLGGNSILAVSMACARAASQASGEPLWHSLHRRFQLDPLISLPQPLIVCMEGGAHADQSTDIQEYLLAPTKTSGSPTENIRKILEVYFSLKEILQSKGRNVNGGSEGAIAADHARSNEEPLEFLIEAIRAAGYKEGKDISLAIDCAASEFFSKGKYNLKIENTTCTGQEFAQRINVWKQKYPLFSVEDPFSEDDWRSWPFLFSNDKTLLVGDDLTVTRKELIEKAWKQKCINAVIIKPNQIGSITETMEAIKFCQEKDITTIVSHRGGGETNDTFIIDLAVAAGSRFVKVGPTRGERVEKYNRLMDIEHNEWITKTL